jgi:fatty-acyl-CoA synthase
MTTISTHHARASSPAAPTLDCYVDVLLEQLVAADRHPVVTAGGRAVSGSALAAMIARYARSLDLLHIGRGDLVALFAPNVPDALAIRYAAHVVGAATMYLPDGSGAAQRAALLDAVDARMVVAFPETLHLVPPMAADVTTIGVEVAGCLRLDALAAVQPSDLVRSRARPDDLAVVISSGGTTGVPKGSARSFLTYAAMVAGRRAPERRQLVNGELAHLSQVLVDQTLLGEGTVVLDATCDPSRTLATIEQQAITDVFLVEPQLLDLVDHPDVDRRDLSSLRTVLHIGASAPIALRRRAQRRLGDVVMHTYGSSEAGIVSALSPSEYCSDDPMRATSAGRVRSDVTVRLRREDGSLAPPGQTGTIEVRSAAAATGYRNRDVDDTATFADGWVRTGDLGFIDPAGFLHVLGRATDVTTVDGELVTPRAVEDELMRLPDVRAVSVVVDHDTGRWIAAVVPWPGRTVPRSLGASALSARTVAAIALTLVPVDHVPLTGQGKPDRGRIIALALDPVRSSA